MSPPIYDDTVGWVRVDGVVTTAQAAHLASACDALPYQITIRSGDKPHGRTRRLTALEERLPETQKIAQSLGPVVDQLLPTGWTVTEIAFRCPGPGTGGQQLHADDLPLTDPDAPCYGATAIVALVPFTRENGATRVVPGSHRRIDLQRLSQQVDHLPDEHYLVGKAGTAFVFSRHLLHAGSPNRSERARPALQISYQPKA